MQTRKLPDLKRCQSKVYLRSDTVFLRHFKEKRKLKEKTLNEEEAQKILKKKYVSERKDHLSRLLQLHKLVPLRSVLSQIGRETVVLNSVPKHFEIIQPLLKNDPYVQQLDLSHTELDTNCCHLLTGLTCRNYSITCLTLNDCGLNGSVLRSFTENCSFMQTKNLQLEDNNITERDYHTLGILLKRCSILRSLSLKGNKLESEGCTEFSSEIGNHRCLETFDLSWNHIRRNGAIDIAKGIQANNSLKLVNLSWNGFGYEGCSALSDALEENKSLVELDICSNRIHPPALLELMKGLCNNSTLEKINLSHNPITPAVTTIFLEALFDTNFTGLKEIIMEKVVVDHGFPQIVRRIQQHRSLSVKYQRSLPFHVRPEKLRMEVQAPSVFNMDPLKLLYLLKEKNRAQDFFNKINKDNNDVLTIDEIQALFREMGVSVTTSVVDKIMEFMDTDQSGSIDLGEFLDSDKRIRKMSRDHARLATSRQGYNKYSRSFARGHIDPMTFQLRVHEPKQLLPPIKSREPSISPVPRTK